MSGDMKTVWILEYKSGKREQLDVPGSRDAARKQSHEIEALVKSGIIISADRKHIPYRWR